MKTILVTGGAGFIGSHTVVELIDGGYRPVIVDDFSNSDRPVIENLQKLLGQSITYYEQDYSHQSKLRKIIEDEKVDGIIHFAAFKQVGESVQQPLKYYANNVSGLVGLLEMADAYGIKHFVFSSSCTVYGEPSKLPVTEDSPLQPAESPYGATKQMGETIVCDSTTVSKTLNSMSLRYFNPIGAHPSALIGELPRGVPANLVPFITQTAAGLREKLTIYGDDYSTDDGSCIRDYIHVVDLAKAHVSALGLLESKPPAYYDVVNIGTGKGSSVLELVKTFESVSGVKLNYEIGSRRKGDITSTYASVGKAAGLLGWTAEKTLEDSLADAWRWQQTLPTENA